MTFQTCPPEVAGAPVRGLGSRRTIPELAVRCCYKARVEPAYGTDRKALIMDMLSQGMLSQGIFVALLESHSWWFVPIQ